MKTNGAFIVPLPLWFVLLVGVLGLGAAFLSDLIGSASPLVGTPMNLISLTSQTGETLCGLFA
jgi:hypothetical protein